MRRDRKEERRKEEEKDRRIVRKILHPVLFCFIEQEILFYISHIEI